MLSLIEEPPKPPPLCTGSEEADVFLREQQLALSRAKARKSQKSDEVDEAEVPKKKHGRAKAKAKARGKVLKKPSGKAATKSAKAKAKSKAKSKGRKRVVEEEDEEEEQEEEEPEEEDAEEEEEEEELGKEEDEEEQKKKKPKESKKNKGKKDDGAKPDGAKKTFAKRYKSSCNPEKWDAVREAYVTHIKANVQLQAFCEELPRYPPPKIYSHGCRCFWWLVHGQCFPQMVKPNKCIVYALCRDAAWKEHWWQLCVQELKEHGGDLKRINQALANKFLKEEKVRCLFLLIKRFFLRVLLEAPRSLVFMKTIPLCL